MEKNKQIMNGLKDFPEEVATALGKDLSLYQPGRTGETHVHFTTSELMRFIEKRFKLGEHWQMPEELAKCQICLNSFEALIEASEEKISDELVEKIVGQLPVHKTFRFAFFKYALKLAAGFLIIFSIWYGMTIEKQKAYPSFSEGMATGLDGKTFLAGSKFPGAALLAAANRCVAEYMDGSKIMFEAGSLFAFKHNFLGNKIIELKNGAISADVAKQPFWRTLIINTELGNIKVIGTRFDVKVSRTTEIIFEQKGSEIQQKQSDKISSVLVSVKEGTVAVTCGKETIKLQAGSKAILEHNGIRKEVE